MQRAKEIELKAQQPRLRPQCRSVVVDSITTATPSTKNTGKQSTKTMEGKLQAIVRHLNKLPVQGKTTRLLGIHFTDQAKFNNAHYQKILSPTTQADKTQTYRCHCCHIFDRKRDNQKGNRIAVYVCECKEEGTEDLNGACNKILYCAYCWNIMHVRESFEANIHYVRQWLDLQTSKSTRSKASSCNASSSGTFRNISSTNKRLNFGNT